MSAEEAVASSTGHRRSVDSGSGDDVAARHAAKARQRARRHWMVVQAMMKNGQFKQDGLARRVCCRVLR
jgi:hypothetical protein